MPAHFPIDKYICKKKGLSKGSLIGLTTSRSSVHPPLTPVSGPPSSSSLLCLFHLLNHFFL